MLASSLLHANGYQFGACRHISRCTGEMQTAGLHLRYTIPTVVRARVIQYFVYDGFIISTTAAYFG